VGSFEDELRAQAEQRYEMWSQEHDVHRALTQQHQARRDANRAAIESFIAAMGAAGRRPRRWRVRVRGLDNKKRRARALKGWVFASGSSSMLLTKDGVVHTVSGVRRPESRRRTLITPQRVDLAVVDIERPLLDLCADLTASGVRVEPTTSA
jgi:hypothetical protein